MALVALPLLVETIIVIIIALTLLYAERTAGRAAETKSIAFQVSNISQSSNGAAASLLSYNCTKNPMFSQRFQEYQARMPSALEFLQGLGADEAKNPLYRINRLARRGFELFVAANKSYSQGESKFVFLESDEARKQIEEFTNQLATETSTFQKGQEIIIERAISEYERAKSILLTTLVLALVVNVGIAVFLAHQLRREIGAKLRASRADKRAAANSLQVAELERSIDELKQSLQSAEVRERTAIEQAADVVCTIDESGNFLKVNQAAIRRWGYKPTELAGRSVKNFLTTDGEQEIARAFEQARQTKKMQVCESRFTNSDDEHIFCRWSIEWSTGQNNYFCIVQDISLLKEAERMKQELSELIKRDLRGTLTEVTSFISLLEKGSLGEFNLQGKQQAAMVARNTARLIGMTNKMLELENLETGQMQLDRQQIDLDFLLADVVDSFYDAAEEKMLTLKVGDTRAHVFADPARLRQVLENLLSNAVKFSPVGGVVKVSVVELAPEVEVRIADQGPGVPAEMKEAIFQKFSRSDGSDAPKGGTGLGLAICKAIIARHGGTIGVDSQEGQGSMFWFRLAMEDSSAQDEPDTTCNTIFSRS
jgi:PAS domain S-box-containing protein